MPGIFLQRLMAGDVPKLTPDEIAAYAESQNRSALSLIAAWSMSRDEVWLREASERFADDPRVAIAMLIKDESVSEKAIWADTLKRHDPDNALGPLLAARFAFDSGDPAAGMAELEAAQHLKGIELHRDAWQAELIAAYRSAGYAGPDAEWAGMAQLPVPLSDLSALSGTIADAMAGAHQSGNRNTVETLGRLGMRAAALVGSRGERDLLITQMISLSMERAVLAQLHVFDLIPGDKRLVADRLAETERRITRISHLTKTMAARMTTPTDSEFRQFTRRLNTNGELAALEWLAKQRVKQWQAIRTRQCRPHHHPSHILQVRSAAGRDLPIQTEIFSLYTLPRPQAILVVS